MFAGESVIDRFFGGDRMSGLPRHERDVPIQELLESTRRYFRERSVSAPEEWIRALAEKAEGEAAYLKLFFRACEKKTLTCAEIPDLPAGFVHLTAMLFERTLAERKLLSADEFFPLLSMLLTSVEPVSRGVLKYCFNFRFDSGLNSILRFLELFFVQSGLSDTDTVQPFMPQIREAFLSPVFLKRYPISQVQALERFAESGLRLWRCGRLRWTTISPSAPSTAERYFLERLPLHLLAIHEKDAAAQILTDFSYLMKRVRFLPLKILFEEYRQLPSEFLAENAQLRAFADFLCLSAPRLEQETEQLRAYQILLQLACEEHPESPVAKAAREWLDPPFGPSPCDWFWVSVSDPETGESLELPQLNYGNRLGLDLEDVNQIQEEKRHERDFESECLPIPISIHRPSFLFRYFRKFATWGFLRVILVLLALLFMTNWSSCSIFRF